MESEGAPNVTQPQVTAQEERPPRAVPAIVLATVLVCSGLIMWTAYFDEWLSPYIFDGDAEQHVWWTYRWSDPELFPRDLIYDFFSLPIFAPLGYQAVYRVLVPFVDAEKLSKALPVPLMVFSVLACFVAFRRWCKGGWLGPTLATFLFVLICTRYFRGGLPRSFAMPVVAAFAWLSTSRRVWPLGVGLLIAVLFYPPPVTVLGLTSLAIIFWRWRQGELAMKDLAAYAAITILAVGVFLACYTVGKPKWVGHRPTAAQVRSMPEFFSEEGGGHGRGAMFGTSPVDFYLTSQRTGLGIRTLYLMPLLVLGVVVAACRRFRDAVPALIPGMIVASLALFIAAHILLPRLFYPNRHVRYTMPVPILGLTALMITWPAGAVAARRPGARNFGRRYWWLALLPFVLLTAHRIAGAVHDARTLPPPDPSEAAVIEFCRQTPKDTLFAGLPSQMDPIPLLARRSVLASHETALPHYLGYYSLVRARIEDELRLLHATSWPEALGIAGKYGVGYVIVPRDLLDPKRPLASPPHRELDVELRKQAESKGAVMLNPPPGRRVLRTERYDIVDVRAPGKGGATPSSSPSGDHFLKNSY